jgi:hypothetical protein
MNETINNASAAASTLFLGHNGEWWDFWLIISVAFAAVGAIAIGITTTGSIASHTREAVAAGQASERFKLETEGKISDSNARAAELKLAQLRKLAGPREINFDKLNEELKGQPKAAVAIWYVPEVSDGY